MVCAIGAGARYLCVQGVTRISGHGFPYGTMAVNIAGSFAMGLLIAWLASRSAGDNALRLFIATGVLGGFTTFSAFSLDFAVLFERGEMMVAFGYVAGSVALSIGALFAGLMLARAVF